MGSVKFMNDQSPAIYNHYFCAFLILLAQGSDCLLSYTLVRRNGLGH